MKKTQRKKVVRKLNDIEGRLDAMLKDQTVDHERADKLTGELEEIISISDIKQDLSARAKDLRERIDVYTGKVTENKEVDKENKEAEIQASRTYQQKPIVPAFQRRYTSLEVGDTIDIYKLEKTRHGTNYIKNVGEGRNILVFAKNQYGIKTGWSGKARVVWQNPNKPYIFSIEPIIEEYSSEAAKAREQDAGKQKASTIDDMISIYIGDVGATDDEKTLVYVPKDVRDMKFQDAIRWLIYNGETATPQGQSILKSLRAHYDSGRSPLCVIEDETAAANITLGEYLKRYSEPSISLESRKNKDKKITPPEAVEVLPPEKNKKRKSKNRKYSGGCCAPTVGIGGRRRGAGYSGLDQIVCTYRR